MIITYYRGNELLGHVFRKYIIKREYGIKSKCATSTRELNIRKTHHVIENLVHTFDLKNNYLDNDEPWSGILADKDFAVQNMYHTIL